MAGELLRGVDKSARELPFRWVGGQILLWAGFQLICVPMILLEKPFSAMQKIFNLYTALLLGAAFVVFLMRKRRLSRSGGQAPDGQRTPYPENCSPDGQRPRHPEDRSPDRQKPRHPEGCSSGGRIGNSVLQTVKEVSSRPKSWYVLWAVAAALLLLQLILMGFLAYEEGDDAFYVALSTITLESDTMYFKLPYTGGTTGLDARHGLAPFPMWIAHVAKAAGISAATAAHIAAPIVLLLMAYAIYYLIGKKLLAGRLHQLPFFMILTELLVLFGGYSVFSAENFLLVRTSQGKAVVANIILPFLMLLLLLLLEKLQKGQRIGLSHWLLLGLSMVAGCLCSTLGSMLTCMLLGIVGVCGAVCYRRWTLLFPLGACCLLPACCALLYFTLS